ncbi:MAG TPA: hypothetical protein PKY05_08570 [Fibrobacteria bacterium]|mgnify:FL=1|nr:hypothetical protein [Fibrobacteria bacterium]
MSAFPRMSAFWMASICFALAISCDKKEQPAKRCMDYQTLSMHRATSRTATTASGLDPGEIPDNSSWTIKQMRMFLGVEGHRKQDFDPESLCTKVDERIRGTHGCYSRQFARQDMACTERLSEVGHPTQAMRHLARVDSVSENDPSFARDSFGSEWERVRRDLDRSILAYDLGNCPETMEKLLSSEDYRLPILYLCLREAHSPIEILEELDLSVERMEIGTFQDAPTPIQKSLRSYGVSPGPQKYGWTKVFGMYHLLSLPHETDSQISRVEFLERYKSDGLYAEMYCLPNRRDSLELVRHGSGH